MLDKNCYFYSQTEQKECGMFIFRLFFRSKFQSVFLVACVAGVSVRFRSKERGARPRETENPLPWSLFVPKKPNRETLATQAIFLVKIFRRHGLNQSAT